MAAYRCALRARTCAGRTDDSITVDGQQISLNGAVLLADQVVVFEQPSARRRDVANLVGCSGQWQRHHEFTAEIEACAVTDDGPAVCLYQLANDRQADAQTPA